LAAQVTNSSSRRTVNCCRMISSNWVIVNRLLAS
jgi:hypothetical protein